MNQSYTIYTDKYNLKENVKYKNQVAEWQSFMRTEKHSTNPKRTNNYNMQPVQYSNSIKLKERQRSR